MRPRWLRPGAGRRQRSPPSRPDRRDQRRTPAQPPLRRHSARRGGCRAHGASAPTIGAPGPGPRPPARRTAAPTSRNTRWRPSRGRARRPSRPAQAGIRPAHPTAGGTLDGPHDHHQDRTRLTQEQRRGLIAALHETIAAKVEALRDTDQWRTFLDLTSGFHHYSLNNLILIWSQRPDATGYTTTDGTRRVVIDADLAPAQAAKTALHEAAHALLHAYLTGAEYAQHRGVCETEAESVTYVVAGLLGLDTSAYSIGYVAGWSDADSELIRSTAANVLRAVHTIADALTADHTKPAAAAA